MVDVDVCSCCFLAIIYTYPYILIFAYIKCLSPKRGDIYILEEELAIFTRDGIISGITTYFVVEFFCVNKR